MRRLSRNGSQSSADRDTNSPKSPQKKRLHADESPRTERVIVPLAGKLEEERRDEKTTSHCESKNHSGPNSSCSCSDSCHASVSCSSSDDDNHIDINKPSSNAHSFGNDLQLIGSTKHSMDDKMRNSIEDSHDFLNNSCESRHTFSRHSSIDENSDLEPHFIPTMISDTFNLSEAESEVRKMIRQCSQVSVADSCCHKVSASFEGERKYSKSENYTTQDYEIKLTYPVTLQHVSRQLANHMPLFTIRREKLHVHDHCTGRFLSFLPRVIVAF